MGERLILLNLLISCWKPDVHTRFGLISPKSPLCIGLQKMQIERTVKYCYLHHRSSGFGNIHNLLCRRLWQRNGHNLNFHANRFMRSQSSHNKERAWNNVFWVISIPKSCVIKHIIYRNRRFICHLKLCVLKVICRSRTYRFHPNPRGKLNVDGKHSNHKTDNSQYFQESFPRYIKERWL